MSTTPIPNPLEGEHVIGVYPDFSARSIPPLQKRLNFLPGRSLSDTALSKEQDFRTAHLDALGQSLTAGVITGLEVTCEPQTQSVIELRSPRSPLTSAAAAHLELHIQPGQGLTQDGRWIALSRAWQIPLEAVPTYNKQPIKDVGILLLHPLQISALAGFDDRNPCEYDPQHYAFEDWQRVEGCQLVLYPWPQAVKLANYPQQRWRNELAHTIFQAERDLTPGTVLPWERVGLPIALLCFHKEELVFCDRDAVVRQGGLRRPPTPLVANAGHPGLWQAQIQQFTEHLAEVVQEHPIQDEDDIPVEIGRIAASFRYLPPVGFLPKEAIAFPHTQNPTPAAAEDEPEPGAINYFFPDSYALQVAPIPTDQLEPIVRANQSLSCLDTDAATTDPIQILVPVPAEVYDPELLKTAMVDTSYQDAIDQFSHQRLELLGRQDLMRARADLISRALTGKPVNYAITDLDALDDEVSLVPAQERFYFLSDNQSFWFPSFMPKQAFVPGDSGVIAFIDATDTLNVNAGDNLTLWTYLDSEHPPSKITVTWKKWYGEGSVGKIWTGDIGDFQLPKLGSWVQLRVPASGIGLVDNTKISGLTLKIEGNSAKDTGKAAFVAIGKQDDDTSKELIWVGNDLPAGAQIVDEDEEPIAPDNIDWEWVALELQNGVELVNNALTLQPIEDLKQELTQLHPSGQIWVDTEFQPKLEDEGLAKFILSLNTEINVADDQIEFGFLSSRTNIYRMREFALGIENSQRLLTSPTLTEITKKISAAATQKDLNKYFTTAKNQPVEFQIALSELPDGMDSFEGFLDSITDQGLKERLQGNLSYKKDAKTLILSGNLSEQDLSDLSSSLENFQSHEELKTALTKLSNYSNWKPTIAYDVPSLGAGASRMFINPPAPVNVPASTHVPASANVSSEQYAVNMQSLAYGDTSTKQEVIAQQPIIGAAPPHLSLGERLRIPAAFEARQYALAEWRATIARLGKLEIFQSLAVPGMSGTTIKDALSTLMNTEPEGTQLTANSAELDYFASTVGILDYAVAALRQAEGRAYTYRLILQSCQQTQVALKSLQQRVHQRLQEIDDELDKTRRGLTLARDLWLEEKAEVEQVNQQRQTILQTQVPYLVYHRSRQGNRRTDYPTYQLSAKPEVSLAAPICAHAAESRPPVELGIVLELLLAAPIEWFTYGNGLLQQLDTLTELQEALKSAKAIAASGAPSKPQWRTSAYSQLKLDQTIKAIFDAHWQALQPYRTNLATLDLAALSQVGWRQASDRAAELITLGDLMKGHYGQPAVADAAETYWNTMGQVLNCLYRELRDLKPTLRVDWARGLQSFAQSAQLRNLANLSRWGQVPQATGTALQNQVDWLFKQVKSDEPEAVTLMGDALRVVILMASYVPVNPVVIGRAQRETAALKSGTLVPVLVDTGKAQIGMQAHLYDPGKVLIAKGTVVDLMATTAQVRVDSVLSSEVKLLANALVELQANRSDPSSPSMMAAINR